MFLEVGSMFVKEAKASDDLLNDPAGSVRHTLEQVQTKSSS
jgi:hypothetical protein